MGSLLTELGKKLAERWMSLLVLPGGLYLAVAATAHALGHTHALDMGRLTDRITGWAMAPAVATVGGQVVLLAAVLAASAVAGLIAQATGSLMEQLHLAAGWQSWPQPLRLLARGRTAARQSHWRAAATHWHRHREEAARARTHGERHDPAERRAAHEGMLRIGPEHPERPTWSGDRIHAVTVSLHRDHHLDLSTVWPCLWLILPEEIRTEISAARQALTRATTLMAWALLYLPLALLWWPGALAVATLALAGWRRTRTAADAYAVLLDAATRLHVRDLAERMGLDLRGPLTPEAGDALTRLLSPSTPPIPRPTSST
ncbi:hypothetical protein R1Y80_26465 [Streptomyces sp. JL1001]|uniref:Vegetative cell wall protein gp1 n=1 Tax=Streptomyces sp. JL1001 TaxID=3078227 RepID=A0AAU8KPI0_9ACTN